jgi:hypothetical protein
MFARAALLAVLALAPLPAAAVAAPWSAPRSITVRGQAREPVVALGGPDGAGVAYVRRFGGADRVELRQGTLGALHSPTIIARDARHGLDAPALTFSEHAALVGYRRLATGLRQPARVIELASLTRGGVASGPRELTGPPNAYEPAFAGPRLLRFWRRKAAYAISISGRRAMGTTRLPAGAAFESVVAPLPDGTVVAVWPAGGAIFAATLDPDASAFGPPARVSPAGGLARSPQLAVTPDGHALAVWTQSGAGGRALVATAAAPGGTFGAPVMLAAPSAQALSARAIGTTAGDVLVTFVSASLQAPAGPLRALRVRPDGQPATGLRTLTPPGERTRDAVLAVDTGAGYGAWVTSGSGRHAVRVVRIAPGGIVGTVRTVSGADDAAATAPAFAMTLRGRAMLAYATRSERIRLSTRAAG